MTTLLQKAFDEAIAVPGDKLTKLAAAALAEHRAGKTRATALEQRLAVAKEAIASGKGVSWRNVRLDV